MGAAGLRPGDQYIFPQRDGHRIGLPASRPVVAGWHFFNLVTRMRIVEAIGAPRTERHVVERLVALSGVVGHQAVVASDSPGFIVNHAGRTFVTGGLKLRSEKTGDVAVLDAILRDGAGTCMGPFELLDLTGLDVSHPVMKAIHAQYYGDDRYRPSSLARVRMQAGLLGRKSGAGFYRHGGWDDAASAIPASKAHGILSTSPPVSLWWPNGGTHAPNESVLSLLGPGQRADNPERADAIVLSPCGPDLTTATLQLELDPLRTVALDPVFASPGCVTLMSSPATTTQAEQAVAARLSDRGVVVRRIADSPGYVAPRVVACIGNLACETAQQGIATPGDIDDSVRLALGYRQVHSNGATVSVRRVCSPSWRGCNRPSAIRVTAPLPGCPFAPDWACSYPPQTARSDSPFTCATPTSATPSAPPSAATAGRCPASVPMTSAPSPSAR
jgi:3-hydroxybutyryl-CoA dehydrogenase